MPNSRPIDYHDVSELNKFVYATLRPSPIHGVGVFAIRDIPKGASFVGSHRHYYKGLTEEDLTVIHPEIKKLIAQRHGSFSLFQSPNDDVKFLAFMNHSDTPNSDFGHALRKIKADEEITEDYRNCSPSFRTAEYLAKILSIQ